jgi:hypothetical protein
VWDPSRDEKYRENEWERRLRRTFFATTTFMFAERPCPKPRHAPRFPTRPMQRDPRHWLVGMAALAASWLVAAPSRAVDPFEIQVYDGSADPQGVPAIELHVNHVASGLKGAVQPELPQHHQSHFTLEPRSVPRPGGSSARIFKQLYAPMERSTTQA